jgi:RNA polymerase sigma-70 factor (ECF subfamily)
LRNNYLTEMRRNRFRGDYDETVAERLLVTPAGQEAPLHLADLHRALLTLAPERREALLLVGAGAFPMRKPPRSVVARWARSRAAWAAPAALSAMIENGQLGGRNDGQNRQDASGAILDELGLIAQRSPHKPD